MERDPFDDWIGSNFETLASLGSGFVAIHPIAGVLVFDSDEEGFGFKLSKLSNTLRSECLFTHTDLYLGFYAPPFYRAG